MKAAIQEEGFDPTETPFYVRATIIVDPDPDEVIETAPHVKCPSCVAEMMPRTLVPVVETEEYRATYRCPQCGNEIQRQFTPATRS